MLVPGFCTHNQSSYGRTPHHKILTRYKTSSNAVRNQSNFMEIFCGKTEILKQEAGPLVKISYPNIEGAVVLIIPHVLDNRSEVRHLWRQFKQNIWLLTEVEFTTGRRSNGIVIIIEHMLVRET